MIRGAPSGSALLAVAAALLLGCGGASDQGVASPNPDGGDDATVDGSADAPHADAPAGDATGHDGGAGDGSTEGSGGAESGAPDAGDAGGSDGGGSEAGVDAGSGCVPSGTTCYENGPNPPPNAPPDTPCCDGVCNHATNHCGCSGTSGPCSGLDFLYGPDCCPGLQCLDNGSAMICGVCLPDGTQCSAAGLCCYGICNSKTGTCGCSATSGPCTDSTDCCAPAYCSSAHQCVIDVVCSGDGAACTAPSDCCSQICNTVSGRCGCGFTGTGCTTSTDCCATASPPLCNSLGTCGCITDGNACGAAADCCTGVCNGTSGHCGCSAVRASCTVAGDCCAGLTCGAAKTCCKATGQSCSTGPDCCSGNCKGNGTCT
ncbi:MAG: hypothetical protein ACRELB_15845 [Polyangiaceae bacterium]